jgi:hypothetical protein
MPDAHGRDDPGPWACVGPLAGHYEAHVSCKHFESLLLARVMVGRHIPSRLGENLGAQASAIACERKPLAANGIVDELRHGISFRLGLLL